jgi:hypothetical protein
METLKLTVRLSKSNLEFAPSNMLGRTGSR